jgi:hypothetical protein
LRNKISPGDLPFIDKDENDHMEDAGAEIFIFENINSDND